MPTTVRSRRVALLTAPLVTALAIGAGVTVHGLDQPTDLSAAEGNLGAVASADATSATAAERSQAVSRSSDRVPLAGRTLKAKPKPVAPPKVTRTLWTTAPLKVRQAPRGQARSFGTVGDNERIGVTGKRQAGYAQVVVDKQARWVTAAYLSATKQRPQPQPGARGLVDQPCAGTSEFENGLTSGAVRVYRAVCNNFPQITTYGGYDAHGEHASGKAIDIMTSDSSLGDQIAAFLQANASALDLYDIIWQQHIWTPVRASEGWRSMSDRGSETANHYDHVHVSVN